MPAPAVRRCFWVDSAPDHYVDYHDREWGFPVADDRRLFEKLCLEGFQSGLSWLTILNKREAFRAAFAGFDFARVAGCSGSSGWRTASLAITPPSAITVLVARSPHCRFSKLMSGRMRA